MILYVFILLLLASCAPKLEQKRKYTYKYPKGAQVKIKRSPGSLYTDLSKAYLFGSVKASQVGDIIYVRVVESIDAIERVSANVGRSASFSNAISAFFGLPKSTLRNFGAQGKSSFKTKGSSKYQQTGRLTTTLAGRVIKVFPNGTMLIEAKKYIEVNGARREFLLRGIIRPEDIDANNTITSDKIADMEIFFDGRGYIVNGGEPGWLAKLLAILFPF